jgi:two-component system response regulator FixJ
MTTPPALIYVADDDAAVRRSLSLLLRSAGHRVDDFDSGEALLAALDAGPPQTIHCAVIDVRMAEGGMTGLDVQRALAGRKAGIPVIIVTGHADVPLAVAAMRSGAVDFIEKPYPPDRMLDAVADILAAARPEPARKLPPLTPREREVLTALVAGQSNKEIARGLGISHRTVEVHRAAVMTRLGARTLADAIRMGLDAGLGPVGQ